MITEDGYSDLTLCSVCKEEDKTVQPVAVCSICQASFCDSCLKLHDRMPVSKNHEVELISDKDINCLVVKDSVCTVHPDVKITLYCTECKATICHICQQAGHLSCTRVVDMKSMLPEVKSKLLRVKLHLEEEIQRKKKILERQKCQRRALFEVSSKSESRVKENSEAAINMIRAKECDLLGKLTSADLRSTGGRQVEVYEQMTGSVDQSKPGSGGTDQSKKRSQNQEAFSAQFSDSYVEADISTQGESGARYSNSNVVQSVLETIPKSEEKSPSCSVIEQSTAGESSLMKEKEYEVVSAGSYSLARATTFDHLNTETKVCNRNVSCNIEDIKDAAKEFSLGKVDVIPLGVADVSACPHLVKTVDTRHSKDTHVPSLKDIIVITVDGTKTIVVTYEDNCHVRSFWTRYKRDESSFLELKERPWAITKTEGNMILATLPSTLEIVEIMVYPQLRVRNTISTMKSYYGICYLGESRLAACVRYGASQEVKSSYVDIIDFKGHILKSVRVDNINSPDFACTTSEGNILVSDIYGKRVVCISPEGPLLYSASFTFPTGIHATYSGLVLCADNEKGTVSLLTEIGELVKVLLTSDDGIDYINGLWYEDIDATIYITSRQFVKVFRFS